MLRELRYTVRSPPSTLARPPRRQYLDVDFTDAPVDLHWFTFENYYTASVSVLSAEVHPVTNVVRWVPVVARLQLMADCHAENDAQAWHRLHASAFEPGFDSTRVVRLRIYMLQPSPSWHSHTLQHLAFYTFEPLAAPELAPEPELSQADKERCAKLAGGMAELTVMSHAIRATLAEAAAARPRLGPRGEAAAGALDACAPYVAGEWDDELEVASLHGVS